MQRHQLLTYTAFKLCHSRHGQCRSSEGQGTSRQHCAVKGEVHGLPIVFNACTHILNSKMVNVTDHLPFNLQSRDTPTASTSRLRAESPSPHPSVGTTETTTTTTTNSRSGSSLRPRGGRSGPSKEPALSVRLVRGRDGSHRGGTSRGRLGRFGEERGVEWTQGDNESGATGLIDSKDLPRLHISDPEAVQPHVVPLESPDRETVSSMLPSACRTLCLDAESIMSSFWFSLQKLASSFEMDGKLQTLVQYPGDGVIDDLALLSYLSSSFSFQIYIELGGKWMDRIWKYPTKHLDELTK